MYRLVVIDDEYIVVEGIKAMIARQKLDYEVVGWAYDGIHGLEVVQEQKPDLVITDIRIPGMDGLSLIETAKEVCSDTVFVVISGYTEFEYARRALDLGVRGYIDKPISIGKLKDVLDRVEPEFRSAKDGGVLPRQAKKEYEELEKLLDTCITVMSRRDTGEFHREAQEALFRIMQYYPEIADMKRESYKFLCVLSDILVEQNPQAKREDLVSYQEIERKATKEELKDYGEGVLSSISAYMEADKTGSSHRIILQLLEYINENYDKDIGLNELADMVRMNPAYLSVLFKEEVGTSYVKYLTNLRMAMAKKLLKEGYKVMEVSTRVGYNNYRYFCDIFKRHEGQTPSEYRGSVRKKD